MKPEQAWDAIKSIVDESQKRLEPCCVCGIPTRDRGVFIPDKSEDWGAPHGKQRFIIYPLCDAHDPKDEKVNEEVDKSILEWLNGPNREGVVIA